MNSTFAEQNVGDNQKNITFPEKDKILTLPIKEKLIHLDTLTIPYPRLKQILEKVEECHQSTNISKRPLCMRVSGPSGSGKTTIYDLHQRKYPRTQTSKGKEVPVLYSEIPVPAYIGGLAKQLLYDLGDSCWDRGKTMADQKIRLINLLKDCKVKIIFLDEVQHLVDNRKKLIRDSSDWFKELIDQTQIPVVFLGLPDSSRVFIENEQLANRVRLVETVNPFKYDDEYRGFLHCFDMYLPLEELSGLAELEMSKRIFKATNGYIKNIRDLIVRSAEIAIQNHSPKITIQMFARTFEKFLFCKCETNPFSPRFELNT